MSRLRLTKAVHRYPDGTEVPLPDLRLEAGEELLVLGPSGSGKSTLLHVLAGILTPTSGEYHLADQRMEDLRGHALDRFRGRSIGIVFQRHHLLDVLSVSGNLDLARTMAGRPVDAVWRTKLLEQLDLADKADARISTLSEGQKQRVAIARAVINQPLLLLADEPTASLDDQRAAAVIDLLRSLARETSSMLIISTHDQRVTSQVRDIIRLSGPSASRGGEA